MNAVIMGCGKVGARIAGDLADAGHTVSIIDVNGDAFRRLPPSFAGDTIIGTGIDEDVLRAAGIDAADLFVAVSGKDNRNIMATQLVGLLFDVDQRICRIDDPIREQAFRDLGLTTFCPTTISSEIVGDLVSRMPPATVPAPLPEPLPAPEMPGPEQPPQAGGRVL